MNRNGDKAHRDARLIRDLQAKQLLAEYAKAHGGKPPKTKAELSNWLVQQPDTKRRAMMTVDLK